jgi:CBS-domain-containing membrane protein
MTVLELCSTPAVTAHREETVLAAHGIRRLLVVDHEGRLEGMVTLDDLLQRESLQRWNAVTVVAKEQRKERQTRR